MTSVLLSQVRAIGSVRSAWCQGGHEATGFLTAPRAARPSFWLACFTQDLPLRSRVWQSPLQKGEKCGFRAHFSFGCKRTAQTGFISYSRPQVNALSTRSIFDLQDRHVKCNVRPPRQALEEECHRDGDGERVPHRAEIVEEAQSAVSSGRLRQRVRSGHSE